MTMKHWGALGTVPNQCWLKAMSSLSRKEFNLQWEGTEQKEHNHKGAFRPPSSSSFSGHTTGNVRSSDSSLFFTTLLLFKTAICWPRDAHIPTGWGAPSMQFLLPRCGSSFPESAKRAGRALQGPEPQGCLSAAWRAVRRICCTCAVKTQLTLVVLLSWQTAHRKQTWSSLCGGRVWWRGPILNPCTLEQWEG